MRLSGGCYLFFLIISSYIDMDIKNTVAAIHPETKPPKSNVAFNNNVIARKVNPTKYLILLLFRLFIKF